MDVTRTANTLLIAAVAAQRIVELRVSRRNRARLLERGAKALPDRVFPWMVLAHVVLLAGSAVEPWWLERPFVPALAFTALGAFLGAQAIRFWVLASLGRRWNVRVVASGEDGVVATGPYRWIRHPNYLAVLVETLALPLFHSAWWTWIAAVSLQVPVIALRIREEELYLHSLPEYRRLMGGKPRFVPKLARMRREREDARRAGP